MTVTRFTFAGWRVGQRSPTSCARAPAVAGDVLTNAPRPPCVRSCRRASWFGVSANLSNAERQLDYFSQPDLQSGWLGDIWLEEHWLVCATELHNHTTAALGALHGDPRMIPSMHMNVHHSWSRMKQFRASLPWEALNPATSSPCRPLGQPQPAPPFPFLSGA